LARRFEELHAVAKLAEERGYWDHLEKMTELLRPNSELYPKLKEIERRTTLPRTWADYDPDLRGW
jgi:hypothetical protein